MADCTLSSLDAAVHDGLIRTRALIVGWQRVAASASRETVGPVVDELLALEGELLSVTNRVQQQHSQRWAGRRARL